MWDSGESHKPDTGRRRPEARQHCIAAQAKRAPPSMNSSPSPLTRAHKECIRKCLAQIRETPSRGQLESQLKLQALHFSPSPSSASGLAGSSLTPACHSTACLSTWVEEAELTAGERVRCGAYRGCSHHTFEAHLCPQLRMYVWVPGASTRPGESSQPASPQLPFKPSPCPSPHFLSQCGSLESRVG